MVRITLPILVFLLLLSAAYAQSASQPVAPHPLRQNLDPSFATVVVALVCAFMFVGCFSVYLRHCSDTYITVGDPAGATSCGPRGIDPKLLDTFPILVYSTIRHLKIGRAALECAVCLSEFKDHDTLRLLPNCNHVFHPKCIDAWLASHVTCPLCRAKLKPESRCGEHEIAIGIPNDTTAPQVFDESSVGRTELNSGEERPVNDGDRRSLGRCHSTGHSLDLAEAGKDMERYTLRLAEDVRKQIMVNHEGIRRSASYDVLRGQEGSLKKGYSQRNCEDEGSSRGRLVLPMTPPFVSRSNALASCSSVPSLWASSVTPMGSLPRD